ncbi:MAG: 6-hydroxymethylpterin diphosphokinase MptE-like protein [Spirochaetaceae bacterium]
MGMLNTLPARSGDTTISCNGRFLHSKYDPQKEALRYIKSIDLSQTSVCLLIEPGLDYLAEVLNSLRPDIKVISLHCIDELQCLVRSSVPCYFPSDAKTLFSFLAEHLEDTLISRTSIIEWEPSALVFGDAYTRLSNSVYTYFRIRNSTIHTVGLFGRRWLSNRISSFLDLSSLAAPYSEIRPVIIACPGPSLDDVLPLIMQYRNKFALWALSSSLHSLAEYSLNPDLVFHTDAGYYARHHLRSLYTREELKKKPPIIAAPLTAGRDSSTHTSTYPLLPILSESLLEKYLLQDFGLPHIRVPSHGTVAGTAFRAAQSMSIERVFFAGLDLAYRDIRPHSSGHAFSNLFLASSDRFTPLHSIYFSRSPQGDYSQNKKTIKGQTEALYTYSKWFAEQKRQSRFFRIQPSTVELPNFYSITAEEFSSYAASVPEQTEITSCTRSISRIPAPSFEKKRLYLEDLFYRISSKTEMLNSRHHPREAAEMLRKEPLLSEIAMESDTAAFLRLHKDFSKEALKELVESIDGILNNWKAVLQAYGKE